ncbi:MAG: metabolite traffic protein EboE, partial [Verrucomicrobiota bacterium]
PLYLLVEWRFTLLTLPVLDRRRGAASFASQVKDRVSDDKPYAVGLRLSEAAISELQSVPESKEHLKKWLDQENGYLFTVNGFPYGTFHGSRVKEQVYAPDWTTPERLDYTNKLFDFIAEMAPDGESVSVSTLPGSFKEFISPETSDQQYAAIISNLRSCSAHIQSLKDKTGRDIHLGMEPEPIGLFENTAESLSFFDRLTDGLSESECNQLLENIGINYDTCHFALQYEEPAESIRTLSDNGIRISKIHLSSALTTTPTEESVQRLHDFQDDVYLHQTMVRSGEELTHRFKDLPDAFRWYEANRDTPGDEWRIHFHIPLHAESIDMFGDTRSHISGVMDLIAENPSLCSHYEMETYTWEVLPDSIKSRDVVDQLVDEYRWTLAKFESVGISLA